MRLSFCFFFAGGSEVYTQTLAVGLLRSGMCASVDVFAREHDAFRSDFTVRSAADSIEPRLLVHFINHAREAPYTRFASEPIDAQFRELLQRLQPDIVHFGHLNHLSFGLPSIAKQFGAKVVYTLHDFFLACPRGQFIQVGPTKPDEEPWQPCSGQEDSKCASSCFVGRFSTGIAGQESTELDYWTKWIGSRMTAGREACGSIDAFIAPSVHLQQRLLKELPAISPAKTILMPYGFDRSRLQGRQRVRAENEPFVFGFIGRHQATKGIHLILQAAIHFLEQHPSLAGRFRILIWGRPDASTHAALQRMIDSSVLATLSPPVIEWRPEYANSAIVESVFSKVDAIIVPSIWQENSPLVIHEAQQCSVPVITSEEGGMGELVVNARNGLTFKHRDPLSLSERMHEAVLQPTGMRWLGELGYLHSRDGQVPSIQQHLSDMMNVYGRLMKDQPVVSPATIEQESEYGGLIRRAQGNDSDIGAVSAVERAAAISAITPPPEQQPVPIVPLPSPWRVTFDTNPDDCKWLSQRGEGTRKAEFQ